MKVIIALPFKASISVSMLPQQTLIRVAIAWTVVLTAPILFAGADDSLGQQRGNPFAMHGTEKMIYDARMEPQAVLHKDVIYIVYQADRDANIGNPHIISYDTKRETWSEPVQIATVPTYDHHYAPVLWIDKDDRFHILYQCHGRSGIHMVSEKPGDFTRWKESTTIAPFISYPKFLHISDQRIMMYHRVFGHMGYWTYHISEDGGYTWQRPETSHVDFDQDPQVDDDLHAGSYHTIKLDATGENLHVGFVWKDERGRRDNRYHEVLDKNKRYNLYYLRLNLASGKIYTLEGKELKQPLNKSRAEQCKVLDSDYYLTNIPTLALDADGNPVFLLLMSDKTPTDTVFHFIRRQGDKWVKTPIARTVSTWAGSHLQRTGPGKWSAILVVGKDKGEIPSYGGGAMQKWVSDDDGQTWRMAETLDPEPGLIYNNPSPVWTSDGQVLDDWLVFYGWNGPRSIDDYILGDKGKLHNTGKAFLWHDGEFK
ncbi:MAG: BNR-4 repeat-containing protein [Verrucomicrobia bacterium]|nr:BNR-4 repeat-containing protein [Verrucomicrobiota bacterium]